MKRKLIEKLVRELSDLRRRNEDSRKRYASELSSERMLRKELELEQRLRAAGGSDYDVLRSYGEEPESSSVAEEVSTIIGKVPVTVETIQKLSEEVEYWILVADGIKHDHRCSNHFSGDKRWGPCLRCRLEEFEEKKRGEG